jgi:hypothetical protein
MPLVSFGAISQAFQALGADRLERVRDAASGQTFVQGATQVSGNNTPRPGPLSGLFDGTGITNFGASNQSDLDAINARKPFAGSLNGDTRIGFVLTSDIWRKLDKAILLHAGPSSANWTVGLRASEEEIKSGHARFAQARNIASTASVASNGTNAAQSGSTFWDLPRVGFEFQSGNIMPIPLLLDQVAVPYGLDDFYNFMDLLNQPPLVPSGDDEGKRNYTWVFYTSLQFPQMVLRGFFDPAGVTWPDASESPTSFSWTADFTVFDASPNIWDRDELTTSYQSFMKENVKLL